MKLRLELFKNLKPDLHSLDLICLEQDNHSDGQWETFIMMKLFWIQQIENWLYKTSIQRLDLFCLMKTFLDLELQTDNSNLKLILLILSGQREDRKKI
jgi:hypothetical protein